MLLPKKYAKYMPMSGFPAKKGSALQISISENKKDELNPITRLFVEMAPQVKDKPPSGSSESPFSWEKKIYISLKEEEVGQFLAVFRGTLQGVDIIHKFPIDGPPENQKLSTLSIVSGDFNGKPNWKVALRQKVGNEEAVMLQVFLQPEDVEVLVVILQECIRRMYRLG